MRIPSQLVAGTSLNILIQESGYSALDGWVLNLHLRGPSVVDIVSVAEEQAHRLLANSTDTGSWQPGNYAYSLRAELNSEIVELEQGNVKVTPNIAAMEAGHDNRSWAERSLEAVEAVLERRASLDQERYRINDRELYRTPIPELLKLRDRLRREVSAQRNGNRLFVGLVSSRFPGC